MIHDVRLGRHYLVRLGRHYLVRLGRHYLVRLGRHYLEVFHAWEDRNPDMVHDRI